jgi:HSP20 family protein
MPDFPVSAELRELDDDVRRVFAELSAQPDAPHAAYSRAFQPPLDVLETSAEVEVVIDVSGVPPDALRVVFRGNLLLVAGAKSPAAGGPVPTFHLLEREFGRFARAVRLAGAFDLARARATLASGELTVVLPKRDDRRGRAHVIPVTPEPPTA